MFSAEARSVAPMGPSMRTTPTTFPNGPQRKPVEFKKNRKYRRPSSTGAPKNMAWNKLRQRRSAFRSLAASSAERSKDWATLADALERRAAIASDDQAKLATLQKLGSVYSELGAVNIADEADADGTGYPQLTEEAVVEANPQLIVISDQTAYTA